MKLHANEFVELILKDRRPWPHFKGAPLDLLVTSVWMRYSTPRFQVRGPWTSSTASSLDASCVPRRPAQSNLLQSALPLYGPYGRPQHASWLPGVFLSYIDYASNEAVLTYLGQLVFLLQSICRRAACIGQFAPPQGAGRHLQPWFMHRSGHQANLAQNVSLARW